MNDRPIIQCARRYLSGRTLDSQGRGCRSMMSLVLLLLLICMLFQQYDSNEIKLVPYYLTIKGVKASAVQGSALLRNAFALALETTLNKGSLKIYIFTVQY